MFNLSNSVWPARMMVDVQIGCLLWGGRVMVVYELYSSTCKCEGLREEIACETLIVVIMKVLVCRKLFHFFLYLQAHSVSNHTSTSKYNTSLQF